MNLRRNSFRSQKPEVSHIPASSATRFLVVFAAFVVVVAGLKAAAPVVNPFLLSCFVSILCAPMVNWLVSKKVPSAIAIAIVMVVITTIGVLIGAFVGQSLNDFSQKLPEYEANLRMQMGAAAQFVGDLGVDFSLERVVEYFDPSVAMQMAATTLTSLGGVLTNLFLITLTAMFMLLEASSFPHKLRLALANADASLAQFDTFSKGVNRYLVIKSVVSSMTGILVTVWLWLLGVDYASLWGLVAFMMNYVPNIGSILAAIPAVLLAVIQFGVLKAVFVMGGYMVINILMGNVVEPKYMGKGLGLSALVVFLSLVFWGWVLGPVGMLLSIPLTMIVKIAFEANKDTKWISILLGSP